MTVTDDLDLGGMDELDSLVEPTSFRDRVFPIRDISVRAEGDGRTVEALTVVYNKEIRVSDWEGEYREVIRSGAFTETIRLRGTRVQVFYNHAQDIRGMPSDRFSLPIGVPVEVREDAKGVVTVTRYSATPLGDEVLTLIKDGAIRGMSFGGRWIQSKETEPTRAGQLRLMERLEVDMREYGPTPFPAYEQARVKGVRNATRDRLVEVIRSMPPEARAELATMLDGSQSAAAASAPQQGAGPLEETQPEPDRAVLDRWTFDLERRRRQLQL